MKPFQTGLVSRISQSLLLALIVGGVFAGALSGGAQTTATNIQVTSAVQQESVHRLGVNLADQTFYDSGQMLKNLIFQNPGFEAEKYRSIMVCNAVTANTCTDDNEYSPQPTGFWTGGTYKILSGKSAGMTGSIVASTKNQSSCSGCGQIIQFDQNINTAVGDYFVLANNFPGSGDAGWWDSASGGGTISSETTDLSPETPGKQALLLSASASGASATVTQYFDGEAGLSFIQLNGSFALTFRAKGMGGKNQLSVNITRLEASGAAVYLNQTVTLTNTWQDYTLTFSANETGSALGTVQMSMSAYGSNVELDDVSLAQTNSSASNPTAFRDDVVNALQELHPGTIRMMAGDAALGSDLINQIQVPFARYRMGWSTGGTTTNVVAYGIHEFLQLCETVGADPWITIPTATTPAEMQAFIQYLAGTGSDQYSSLRISRGQSAPWTSVFNKIHLELGNETWNGSFRGESMNYSGYPGLANQIFGAARATSGYQASKFDLVLDGFTSAGYDQVLLATSTQHDSIDMAPYLLFSANNEPMPTMFGALFAEPEMWLNPSGALASVEATVKTAPTPTYLNVYETNLGTMTGAITETQLNQLTPSIGAGLAHTVHMLELMRTGVQYQNAFALPQYEYQRSDGNLVKLWGIVFDMGTTNRRRPQFLTQAMANAVIGGNMLQTTQTGANPTWNQPLSSDSVQLNGAHFLQSFAFQNGGTLSTVIFNLNQTSALPVTFSGPNAPSGSVQMTQITSANVTDNNETSTVVASTTQTLSGFNPATGITLPPFSMTVLSWSNTVTPAPVFSVAPGTYTSAQTVSLSDGASGAVIYYTTDGSTPTTASNVYSSSLPLTGTETINAMAIASGLSPSSVSSASYQVVNPTAATPVLSMVAGTYTSAQTVSISSATPGSTIYYTTNGAAPTTASTVCSGPIKVAVTETLQAITVAPNYINSAVASATYTISSITATPVLSVAAGTYTLAQTVSITDATAGAAIYYTTNGTTPTTSSSVYSGPITVSTTETVEAIAVAPKYSNSAIASAAYTITAGTQAPVFSVAPGTYTSAQTVSISSATPKSTIYYQINNVGSAYVYSAPIKVSTSESINAIAVGPTYVKSATSTVAYTIVPAAAMPVFSVAAGTYTSAQTVSISDATSGATIYYTTNGAAPTKSSSVYAGSITVGATETLQAIAVAANVANSAVASAAYTINLPAATPVFSVAPGTYTSAQTVSITDATAGATIYYTTNGSAPTTSSSVYSGPITVSASETLQAAAIVTNSSLSPIASATYTINLPAATPVFSVGAGTYTSAQTVSISDATAGATIYYTTNGSAPTASSSVYAGPVTVSASEKLQATAIAPNSSLSAVASAAYTINLPAATPAFSVAPGTYTSTQTVSITDATAGAAIYYTTNGTTPTTSSSVYSGPITVSATETVEAIAVAPKYSNSAIASAAYTITAGTQAPVFSVAPGAYTSVQTVSISSATPKSTIYYQINNVGSAYVYSAPIRVSKSESINAIAVGPTYVKSVTSTVAYTIK
jgi:hypothetical protein